MSDIMTPMSFEQLLSWVRTEYRDKGSIFGIRSPYTADPAKTQTLFERPLETVIGPAAGPNSQLSQNIIAAYVAGARFFELKTVQKMDGRELAACVARPCIKADDEGYNCEWSTELTVPQAQHEYINAWVMLNFLAKEYGFGAQDGFQFNISVGYDLAGIKTEKVNSFIDNMMEAKDTEDFKTAIGVLESHLSEFAHFTAADLAAIRSDIVNDATISTLHGCPPEEIESIADYLLKEKHLHTFIKLNPTLLGYEFARETMDAMGYDYLAFGRFHFDDDLQYADAVPMLTRLMALAESLGLAFGVKITNTFPVDVLENELPAKEMYMSGKSLYPLSIALAARLSREFDGKLRIAYSGGADAFNIEEIVGCGIWPVTVATTILKPGGYQRISQLASLAADAAEPFKGIDVARLNALAEKARVDAHHVKAAKPLPSRKIAEKVSLFNCFIAPCRETCPIGQDIPVYMDLSRKGKFKEAMEVILRRNALPFMTGTLCAHPCQNACTRNFYESQVHIRDTKLTCAMEGAAAIDFLTPAPKNGKKVGIIGGGPAGMASAYYLARGGCEVTIFEKEQALGGVPRYVIPDFRIDGERVDRDVELLKKLGVTICTNCEKTVADVKADGFDYVVTAIGAPGEGSFAVPGIQTVNALSFLRQFNETKGKVSLGHSVVVVGGGNTAMDTARAALRNEGVEQVYLVYRRTKRFMPADEEELLMAVEDGVIFRELRNPVSYADGMLTCAVMKLGERGADGRRGVVKTEETEQIPCDTLIAAVGEKCDGAWYEANGIAVDEKGRPKTDENYMTSLPGVYAAGDGLFGPSIIVKAAANAQKVAKAILGEDMPESVEPTASPADCFPRKGYLTESGNPVCDGFRCLTCDVICENCVDVCPNRANVEIKVPGYPMPQILHVDWMCNECGNCRSFCPYDSAPYREKLTLFADKAAMAESDNDGFVVLDQAAGSYYVRFLGNECQVSRNAPGTIPGMLMDLMETVRKEYTYLIP